MVLIKGSDQVSSQSYKAPYDSNLRLYSRKYKQFNRTTLEL